MKLHRTTQQHVDTNSLESRNDNHCVRCGKVHHSPKRLNPLLFKDGVNVSESFCDSCYRILLDEV